jgi:hypothetical protein
MTKARGVARWWAKRKPGSHITYSQGNSHFGKWSPGGFSKLQKAILGIKNQWIVAFFISMKSSWNVDV